MGIKEKEHSNKKENK